MNVVLTRRAVLRGCAVAGAAALPSLALTQAAVRVVFLNPGEAAERGTGPFWRTVTQLMEIAARSLDIELETLYAERNHLLMLRQAEEVAHRSRAPEFVVMVNEKAAAPQMMEILSRSSAKILVIHSDLTAEQRQKVGNERQRFSRWIGTAVADNARGCYLMMQELYRQLGKEEPRIIGITGDPSTPVSFERAHGVQQFVEQAGRGQIVQLANGDWSYTDGEAKGRVLLARFPQANVVWAANDSMAMGALRAVAERKVKVLVGGNGGWPDAVQSIAERGLAATAAGHSLIGAWAMVLVHDYSRGVDFAQHGGGLQKVDYLYVVNRERASRYAQAIFANPEQLDFRAYSKVLRPRVGPYDFRMDPLIRTAGAR